jgi:transcriptional regulator with XRE-family HTH domain
MEDRAAMALFFDAAWFDARLGERGLSREVMAAAAGLSAADLALTFKDQREISAGEVAVFAELLGVEASEVARHAGISTPVPRQDAADGRVAALERRVAALEAEVARLRR